MGTRSTRALLRWLALAGAALLLPALACGGDRGQADALPPGWAGARALSVQQSTCTGDALSTPKQPRLELTPGGGGIIGVYRDAQFRCGDQVLCGWGLDVAAATRVLIQPCDLHPAQVPRCDCLYDVTFTLVTRADRTSVELYRRTDLYAQTKPVAPSRIDTQPVP